MNQCIKRIANLVRTFLDKEGRGLLRPTWCGGRRGPSPSRSPAPSSLSGQASFLPGFWAEIGSHLGLQTRAVCNVLLLIKAWRKAGVLKRSWGHPSLALGNGSGAKGRGGDYRKRARRKAWRGSSTAGSRPGHQSMATWGGKCTIQDLTPCVSRAFLNFSRPCVKRSVSPMRSGRLYRRPTWSLWGPRRR